MKKILLIEDNEFIRENAAQILAFADYEVIVAENGAEGVELAVAENPDLIICDIMMPELDGFGVLQKLRSEYETAGIPFIILSAKSAEEDVARAKALGANDYLVKPFYEQKLLDAVAKQLKHK